MYRPAFITLLLAVGIAWTAHAALAQSAAGATYNDAWPTYSPDGGQIAFTSTRSGKRQLYVMQSDGRQMRHITIDSALRGDYGGVGWLPNGDILFSLYEPTEFNGLNNDLSSVRFVRSTTNGERVTILFEGINVERPSPSPDGRSLVFESERGRFSNNTNIDLEMLDIKSLTVRALTDGRGEYIQASWSPDGSKIAYACRGPHEAELQICVMDVAERQSRVITRGAGSHQWLGGHQILGAWHSSSNDK